MKRTCEGRACGRPDDELKQRKNPLTYNPNICSVFQAELHGQGLENVKVM
jgi:hypothetical protein